MTARPTWKGLLKLSLVSVPVKAYTATASGGGQIPLNQLHSVCHSRIRYKKTCPLPGEVPNSEIISGYQYALGHYVEIDPDELDKLRTEDEKAINIDAFIPAGKIDELYAGGKAYCLVPDGPAGHKPYALPHQAMVNEDRQAIAQAVLHGKEQLVLVRPMGRLIAMLVLHQDEDVAKPSAFEDEAPQVELSAEEQKLTNSSSMHRRQRSSTWASTTTNTPTSCER
jgi:DNA end-binding protein Ku